MSSNRAFHIAVMPGDGIGREVMEACIELLGDLLADETAFKLHLESDHFKAFDAAVADWTASKTVEAWHRHG